jgi:hypothetical protein
MEELVAWHELGEMLLRNDLLTPDVLAKAREEVKSGTFTNLFEALKADGTVDTQDLIDTLDAGHKEVSMAFLLMKTRVVTMQQLRTAFVMMRKSSKKLGFSLIELGFCNKDQVADAMKLVPPSRFTQMI